MALKTYNVTVRANKTGAPVSNVRIQGTWSYYYLHNRSILQEFDDDTYRGVIDVTTNYNGKATVVVPDIDFGSGVNVAKEGCIIVSFETALPTSSHTTRSCKQVSPPIQDQITAYSDGSSTLRWVGTETKNVDISVETGGGYSYNYANKFVVAGVTQSIISLADINGVKVDSLYVEYTVSTYMNTRSLLYYSTYKGFVDQLSGTYFRKIQPNYYDTGENKDYYDFVAIPILYSGFKHTAKSSSGNIIFYTPDVIFNNVRLFAVCGNKVYTKSGYVYSPDSKKIPDTGLKLAISFSNDWKEYTGEFAGKPVVVPPAIPEDTPDANPETPPTTTGVDTEHFKVIFQARDKDTGILIDAQIAGRKLLRYTNIARMPEPYSGAFSDNYTVLTTHGGEDGSAEITVNVDAWGYLGTSTTVNYALSSATVSSADVTVYVDLEATASEPPFSSEDIEDYGIEVYSPTINLVKPYQEKHTARLSDVLNLVDVSNKRPVDFVKVDNLDWDYNVDIKGFVNIFSYDAGLVVDDNVYVNSYNPVGGKARILLTGQTDFSQNGIYELTIERETDTDGNQGDYIYILIRSSDMDNSYLLNYDLAVKVVNGIMYKNTLWTLDKDHNDYYVRNPLIIDSSPLYFIQSQPSLNAKKQIYYITGDGSEKEFEIHHTLGENSIISFYDTDDNPVMVSYQNYENFASIKFGNSLSNGEQIKVVIMNSVAE